MLSVQKDLVPMILKYINPLTVFVFQHPRYMSLDTNTSVMHAIGADSFDDLVEKTYKNRQMDDWSWVLHFLTNFSPKLVETLAGDTKAANAKHHTNEKSYVNRVFRDAMCSARKRGFIKELSILK